MKQFIYVLKKTGVIFLVFLVFILVLMLGLVLPCAIDFGLLYIITIPLAIAIIIALIKNIDWDELFDFDYYE